MVDHKFKVGDKVVRVDENAIALDWGKVYTVSALLEFGEKAAVKLVDKYGNTEGFGGHHWEHRLGFAPGFVREPTFKPGDKIRLRGPYQFHGAKEIATVIAQGDRVPQRSGADKDREVVYADWYRPEGSWHWADDCELVERPQKKAKWETVSKFTNDGTGTEFRVQTRKVEK
jgi:hypothetical protein